jgi:hypothetical protein
MYARNGASVLMVAGAVACAGEHPARTDVERLLPTLCEQADACACGFDSGCLEQRQALWDARIEAGSDRGLTYDADCLEAQLADLDTIGCSAATRSGDHLCGSYCAVFYGSRSEGESCQGFDEVVSDCAADLVCNGGTCTDPCLVLTGLGSGEVCMSETGMTFDNCADGLLCNFESRTCIEAPGAGESCSNGCGAGLYCDYARNTCAPLLAEGEPCDYNGCREGLFCAWSEGISVCRRLGDVGDPCRDLGCNSGLLCDWEGDRCVSPPIGGEACVQSTCAPGFACDFAVNQCVTPPDAPGSACPLGECGAGLWCDASQVPEGKCSVARETGETCSGHRQCVSGYCPNGYCHDLPLAGDDCRGTALCANGLVCDGATCQRAAGTGSAVCGYAGW